MMLTQLLGAFAGIKALIPKALSSDRAESRVYLGRGQDVWFRLALSDALNAYPCSRVETSIFCYGHYVIEPERRRQSRTREYVQRYPCRGSSGY